MHTKIAERAGRAMDHEAEDSFERFAPKATCRRGGG